MIKAVLADVKEDWCIASAQALGLTSKMITSPFWRILEDKAIHIADMSKVYQCLYCIMVVNYLVQFLEECSVNDEVLLNFIKGKHVPRELAAYIEHDNVIESLIKEDGCTSTYLFKIVKHVFADWSILLQRMLSDHLEGGMFHCMSDQQRIETSSVIKHNKLAEEIFAHMDRLVRIRLNATCMTDEAHIMFMKNKTSQWLRRLDSDKRVKIIEDSLHKARALKKVFHIHQAELSKQRRESLAKKQSAILAYKEKQFKEREAITSKIIHYGLWQSHRDAETNVTQLSSKKDKLDALKSQLNFRRVVLQQPISNKGLYQFSSKDGGILSIDKLTSTAVICVLS